MATKVVDIRTGDYFDVYIGRGRGSILGNPFRVRTEENRQRSIEKFRVHFREKMDTDPVFRAKVLTLKNKILG